jgi:hypothetical protein
MSWKLPLDRMRVMAALETLTRQWDATAARDVVVAFATLPFFRHGGSEWRMRTRADDEQVRGLTEFGVVTTTERRPAAYRAVGAPGEEQVARVGRFKVYRIPGRTGAYPSVIFYDFRGDTPVPGQMPETRIQLLYRASELQPLILARLEPEPADMSWSDHLYCWFMKLRTGKTVAFSTYSLKPVMIHSEVSGESDRSPS